MAAAAPASLHLMARRVEGQWVVACLDFDLAAQDSTFEAAQRRLLDQVESYVQEALAIDGGANAQQLLSRHAPMGHWLLFRLVRLLQRFNAATWIFRAAVMPRAGAPRPR